MKYQQHQQQNTLAVAPVWDKVQVFQMTAKLSCPSYSDVFFPYPSPSSLCIWFLSTSSWWPKHIFPLTLLTARNVLLWDPLGWLSALWILCSNPCSSVRVNYSPYLIHNCPHPCSVFLFSHGIILHFDTPHNLHTLFIPYGLVSLTKPKIN